MGSHKDRHRLRAFPEPSSSLAPPGIVPPAGRAGAREPAASPWLGRRRAPSEDFLRHQRVERALQSLWPWHGLAVAPATAFGAFADWAVHLALSPAKQAELWEAAAGVIWRGVRAMAAPDAAHPEGWCIPPMPQDKRFVDPAWTDRPFCWAAQNFLLWQEWWERATTAVPGVSRHHEDMVEFAARQWLDTMAPSNTLANPVVLQRTAAEYGLNLLRGAVYAAEDAWRELADLPGPGAEEYRPGAEVAATPGRVVLRNQLMELLQYAPTTPTVHQEPILIVPAWIMKYYVLDLQPQNSLVRYLVDRGFTVFCISWRNPTSEQRDLGLEDYDRLGVRAAIDTIRATRRGASIHAVGYCLGGTLLAATAAALGRAGSTVLRSLTLLAAQTDFTEPGELSLFVDESQITWLENQMARRGYLDKRQMRATFELLRSRDLVWSYRLATYLMGERAPVNALKAWNADGTRMPARMHADYLRAFYLDNALAHGEYRLDGMPIHLTDIGGPLFVVGAVQDHVAPWRSVFKLHHLADAELTFVLTAGGHNVGIVNPPGQERSSFRMRVRSPGEKFLTPDEWLAATPSQAGSWWPVWADWLEARSSTRRIPPRLLPALAPAPGSYVLER